jgi:hypothetical protein
MSESVLNEAEKPTFSALVVKWLDTERKRFIDTQREKKPKKPVKKKNEVVLDPEEEYEEDDNDEDDNGYT